jgi:hypothetical protein
VTNISRITILEYPYVTEIKIIKVKEDWHDAGRPLPPSLFGYPRVAEKIRTSHSELVISIHSAGNY